jgi:hypothetical protein
MLSPMAICNIRFIPPISSSSVNATPAITTSSIFYNERRNFRISFEKNLGYFGYTINLQHTRSQLTSFDGPA